MSIEVHPILPFVAGVAFGIAIGLGIAGDWGRIERERAIKAGVAHWTIDPVTGEKRFEYKVKL